MVHVRSCLPLLYLTYHGNNRHKTKGDRHKTKGDRHKETAERKEDRHKTKEDRHFKPYKERKVGKAWKIDGRWNLTKRKLRKQKNRDEAQLIGLTSPEARRRVREMGEIIHPDASTPVQNIAVTCAREALRRNGPKLRDGDTYTGGRGGGKKRKISTVLELFEEAIPQAVIDSIETKQYKKMRKEQATQSELSRVMDESYSQSLSLHGSTDVRNLLKKEIPLSHMNTRNRYVP